MRRASVGRSYTPIRSAKGAAARVCVFIEATRPASAGLFLCLRLEVLRSCVR